MSEDDYCTAVELMEKFGGGFVKALALLWHRADPVNRKILQEAFGEKYFEVYFNKSQK